MRWYRGGLAVVLATVLVACGSTSPRVSAVGSPTVSVPPSTAAASAPTASASTLPVFGGTLSMTAGNSLGCPVPGPADCHSLTIQIPASQGWRDATGTADLSKPYNFSGSGNYFLIQSASATPSGSDVTGYLGFSWAGGNPSKDAEQFVSVLGSSSGTTNISRPTDASVGRCRAAWVTYDGLDPVQHTAVKGYDLYIWSPGTGDQPHLDDWVIELQARADGWDALLRQVQQDVGTIRTPWC